MAAVTTTSFSGRLARIGYPRARQLLFVTGLAIMAVVIAVLFVRRVDTVEVLATVLFVPIFLAVLLFRLPGGIAAAVAASAAYIAMRWTAIDKVGFGEFSGMIVSRSTAYLLFGAIGGWANQTLEQSLNKLDLYDQIDDQTGLNNSRFLLQDVDLEKARAQRYKTVFSLATAEFPAAAIEGLPGRKRKILLRELGRQIDDSVRTVDRAAHGYDGDVHRFAIILPETAREGALIFHGRFVDAVGRFLAERGASVSGPVDGVVITVPGDDETLTTYLAGWKAIDAMEHSATVDA